MGMSTNVCGFKPPDEKWKKMKAVYDACLQADTKVPKAVEDFFGYDPPDDAGVVVDLEKHACCQEYKEDAREGFEIDVTKLPKDVTLIRFYNSW